jgi:hypothetical protein
MKVKKDGRVSMCQYSEGDVTIRIEVRNDASMIDVWLVLSKVFTNALKSQAHRERIQAEASN